VRVEEAERAEEGRLLRDDDIAGIDEGVTDEVDRL